LTGTARPIRLVLLGPPASGKGTQGRRLASGLGLAYLSTGALLREHVEAGSPLGELARPVLARGEYLPDDLMCRILGEWLAAHAGGWVLDGFPRSLHQALFLDDWLEERSMSLNAAVSLEAPLDELLNRIRRRVECPECRWSGQNVQAPGNACPDCANLVVPRADDHEENFLKRHAEFSRLTRPVIGHYHSRGLLFSCQATASEDEVARTLLNRFMPNP